MEPGKIKEKRVDVRSGSRGLQFVAHEVLELKKGSPVKVERCFSQSMLHDSKHGRLSC